MRVLPWTYRKNSIVDSREKVYLANTIRVCATDQKENPSIPIGLYLGNFEKGEVKDV